ncbi:MAG: TonB family protein [Candidatus Omnitrophota bacterium]
MKKYFFITSLILIGLILAVNNSALGGAQEEAENEIKLYLGEARIIPLNNPTRIIIGNPNIVDVTNVTTAEMTLNPKITGTTSLVFWDNFGEQSYLIKVVSENMSEIKRRVDNIIRKLDAPEVYTQLAEEEGKVLLLGNVKTPEEKERINLALAGLKEKITDLILVKEEEAAVEIDVQVLELNKDATNILGLTNPLSSAAGITFTEVGTPGISDLGAKWSALFRVDNLMRATYSGGAYTKNPFAWTVYALVQEGKARVLSRPRLACQSGKEAVLLVGGEKPIMTTDTVTGGGETTDVEYKEFGIKLKIKPTVTEEKRVKLALDVEISEVGAAEILGTASSPSARAYPLSKRNASTELFLDDGQTLSIGGLIKQKSEEDTVNTPGLSNIPILGALFRKKQTKIGGGAGERGNTELFIMLTPTVIPAKERSLGAKERSLKITAVPAVSSDQDFATEMDYSNIVQKRILESLKYPASAQEAGFQGTLKLALRLSYSGELLDVKVVSSSGYKILDDNAVSVAKDIAYYPPFPASINKKELWVEIPIIYRLD